MKMYSYDDIRKLNQALGSFAKQEIDVVSVKTLMVADKVEFFVLTDNSFEETEPSAIPPKADKKPVDSEKKIIDTETLSPLGQELIKAKEKKVKEVAEDKKVNE